MRSLDPTLQSNLSSPVIEPVVFVMLTFKSQTMYVCSAGYNVTFDGNTYIGIGSLCGISSLAEGTEVQADGISLTLSGIDTSILSECETDIQPLAPAKCWFGLMSQGQIIGIPYLFFSGVVDCPTINTSRDTATISLRLESRMALLNRPSQSRYTSADQKVNFRNDSGFDWVEALNNTALRFGA